MVPPALAPDELPLLLDALKHLAGSHELDEVERVVRGAANGLAHADGVMFVVRDGDRVYFTDGEALGPLWRGHRFPPSACIGGPSMLRGETVIVEDVAADARMPHDAYRKELVTSLAMIPVKEAHRLFCVCAYWTARHVASEKEVFVLETIADAAERALVNAGLRHDLRESENRMLAIVSSAMDAIITVDGEHRIVLFNRAAERMFGVGAAEAVGQPVERFVPERFRAQLAADLRGGAESAGALFGLRADGAEFPVEVTVSELESFGQRFYTVILRDVTERRRVEDALVEANRAKDEFLAMLGHELRNPLAPILTAVHLLGVDDGTAHERERRIIERQAKHLVRLVDDLLDISRITRGKIELKHERVEVADVVSKSIEMVSPLLEARGHSLDVHVPSRSIAVSGDTMRLAQIVANLLTNAAKYTEPGGHVSLTAARERDVVSICVRDDGIGIAPEILPHVFDRFVQDRQALDRSRGGLGLGLAIARSLAVQHGGNVVARSEGVGRGSEFVVTLPALDAEAPSEAAPCVLSSQPRRGRVLIVDDNADAADLLASAVEAGGYDVRTTNDAQAALAVSADFRPDAALLDIGLPGMDGYELAARLREQPATKNVGLIAVTGYGQDTDRARTREAGFAMHLVKPVDVTVLLHAIAEILEAHVEVR
jgi:PAS domain S-box-containing protein